jgi:hypothetical protein
LIALDQGIARVDIDTRLGVGQAVGVAHRSLWMGKPQGPKKRQYAQGL